MITELMWKSLDRIDIAYSFFWPCPLEWDRPTRKILCNQYSWKMAPWTISLLFSIIFAQIPCLILVSLSLFGVADVPLKNMAITLIFYILSAFGTIVDLGAMFFAKNFVIGFHFLEAMEKDIQRKSKIRSRMWKFFKIAFRKRFLKLFLLFCSRWQARFENWSGLGWHRP